MGTDTYDDLIELIERCGVAFPRFGDGVSRETISKAEATLGIPLPDSYKWWLANYGGGQIKGDIVYGLDEDHIDAPDIAALATTSEGTGSRSVKKLIVATGNEELFYFDTTRMSGSEYPVFRVEDSDAEGNLYADNFADFLRRRIRELYGIRD